MLLSLPFGFLALFGGLRLRSDALHPKRIVLSVQRLFEKMAIQDSPFQSALLSTARAYALSHLGPKYLPSGSLFAEFACDGVDSLH